MILNKRVPIYLMRPLSTCVHVPDTEFLYKTENKLFVVKSKKRKE